MDKCLIFLNDVPSESADVQKYVKQTISAFFDSLEFDMALKVKFVEIASANQFETTDCYVRFKSSKMCELDIDNSVIRSIDFDRGGSFVLSMCHEFEHINDYVKMMQTKLFDFNLVLKFQKDFERAYICAGFLFWTEFDAYVETLRFAKQENLCFEKIPFGNLVKHYRKIKDLNKKLFYKQDLTRDEASKYIDCVDSFVYLCAKYMASAQMRHSKIPFAKIDKQKDYKKIYSILCRLEAKLTRLKHNPYGEKSYENLFRLGRFICVNIRWKIFKVGLTKSHGKIASFY